jgi:hypothetical protein
MTRSPSDAERQAVGTRCARRPGHGTRVLALAAGCGAFLSVASASDWPALFHVMELLTFALVVTGGGLLTTRGWRRTSRYHPLCLAR